MENSVFGRIIGSVALLLLGSYLFAEGLSNLILLPVALELASLSGPQAVAQVAAWQNQFIIQLTFGIICLVASGLVAFFKFDTIKPYLQHATPLGSTPQFSSLSTLTTEQLMTELKQRVPSR